MALKTRNVHPLLLIGLAIAAALMLGSATAQLSVQTVSATETFDMSSSFQSTRFLASPSCPSGFRPIAARCLVSTLAIGSQNQPFVIGEGFGNSASSRNFCTFGVNGNGPSSTIVFATLTCGKVD